MTNDVPTLHTIVDCLTVRAEWAGNQGLREEQQALDTARQIIVAYAMREDRKRSILAQILERLHLRRVAA